MSVLTVTKALSLTQPWATLIAIGAKRIERELERVFKSEAAPSSGPVAVPPQQQHQDDGAAEAYPAPLQLRGAWEAEREHWPKLFRIEHLSTPPVPSMGGHTHPFGTMLVDHCSDRVVCEWLRSAKVGDRIDTYHGRCATVQRVLTRVR